MAIWPPPEPRRSTVLGRMLRLVVEPAGRPGAQHFAGDEFVDDRAGGSPEKFEILGGQAVFGGRAGQVRPQDVRVSRVGHSCLDRPAEDRLRMMDQVGVQRVVPSDENHKGSLPTPAGAPGLLPHGCQRPGVPGQQCGVEPGDVDTELESVGGGDAQQRPIAQRLFELPAFLGQVTAAVGRDAVDQLWSGVAQPTSRRHGRLFCAVSRADESQRACFRRDQIGHHPGDLVRRGPAHRCPVLAFRVRHDGRLPQHEVGAGARGSVPGHCGNRRSDESRREVSRVGDRCRGQHENRIRTVQPGQPAQSPDHQRDVRSEHSAVGVAFVDHHELQPPQHPGPTGVRRQDPAVEHVRIGQNPAGVRAYPVTFLDSCVPVEQCRPNSR